MMTTRLVVIAVAVIVLTAPAPAAAADCTTVARGEDVVATATVTETPEAECGLCDTAALRVRIEGPGPVVFDDAFPTDDGGVPYYVSVERLEIVRLDGASQQDVYLHYLRPGAYCCSFVARWSFDGTKWTRTVHRLGAFDNSVALQGGSLLVGSDGRLDGVFEPHVASFEPLLVLGVRNSALADITRLFPARVRRSRAALLRYARREPCARARRRRGRPLLPARRQHRRASPALLHADDVSLPRGKASAARRGARCAKLGDLSRAPAPARIDRAGSERRVARGGPPLAAPDRVATAVAAFTR